MRVVFYDLETTGLNFYHSAIIEVCGIYIEDDGETKVFSNLCKPPHDKLPLSHRITQITGINDEMISEAASEEKVLRRFVYFASHYQGTVYFVAHNNHGFDMLFLKARCKAYGIRLPTKIRFLDSILLAKLLFGGKDSYSMKSLCRDFGIKQVNAHRALDDTKCLKKLMEKLMAIFRERKKPPEKDIGLWRDINSENLYDMAWKETYMI